jgi:hypothetical protein
MKQIRKFEMDYMTEEMFGQLKLHQLQELRVIEESFFKIEESDDVNLETVNLNWGSFILNHAQLKIVHMPLCRISVEQFQMMLENLPLLKKLELVVRGFNFGFFTDFHDDFSDEEYKDLYKMHQAERTALLLGEIYDRLEYLKVAVVLGETRNMIKFYLEKHYFDLKFYNLTVLMKNSSYSQKSP